MRDCYSYETLGVKCDSPIYRLHCPWYKGIVLRTDLLHVTSFLNHYSTTTLWFPTLINRSSLNDMNNLRCSPWQDHASHDLLSTPNSWLLTLLDILREPTSSFHVFHQIVEVSTLISGVPILFMVFAMLGLVLLCWVTPKSEGPLEAEQADHNWK